MGDASNNRFYREPPMTPHQTPPSVTDEMVRAAGDVLLGRVNAPEQEIYKAAREALTVALAAMPGGVDERKNTLLKVAEWHEEQAKFFREHCARRAWEGYSGKAASAERKAMVHETCAEHFRQMAEAPTPPTAQEGK